MSLPIPVTFGQPLRTAFVGGFRVTEAVYPPHLHVRAHEHRFDSWTACVAGSFEERFKREMHTCVAGSFLSKSALANHSNCYGASGARVLLIEVIDPARIGSDSGHVFNQVQMLPQRRGTVLVRQLYHEFRTRDTGWQLAMESRLFDLMLLLVRRPRHHLQRAHTWLRDVADRLRHDFASPPSLAVLAQEAGVHPVYLCAAFRTQHGCTPGQFVRRVRVDRVSELLTRTDDPLSSIAFATGFSDQSHLTRQFRASTGMTPGAYRRRHANT